MTPLLDPLPATQWNRKFARHLLNRAGFGVPYGEGETLAAMTPSGAVDRLVDYEKQPAAMQEPQGLEDPRMHRDMRMQFSSLEALNSQGRKVTDEERERIEAQKQKINNKLQAEERQDIERLKVWWLRRMLATPRPLEEKMTLFWHGHFATSAEKVKSGHHNYTMNKLFREKATGNFKLLAYEVGIHPAMLRYLDNDQNRKGRPNENWARELMELFTLGKGNYTENDIKEAARAFTGWASDGEDFTFVESQHDNDPKTFMGRTGNLNGNDIIDVIFEQPAASRFITTKLWRYFAYDDPEPEVVEGLAETLRKSGFELKPMMRQMFLSQAFYSDRAIGTQVKSPAQVAVGTLGLLDVKARPGSFAEQYVALSMRAMGQDLFYPPNVKGWDGGRAWINTNTLMARYHLANFVVQGVATDMGPGSGVQAMFARIKRLAKPGGKPSRLERAKANMAQRIASLEPEGGMMMEGGMMEGGESMMVMDDSMEIMDMGAAMERDMAGADLSRVGVVGDTDGPKGLRLPIAPFDAAAFFRRAEGLPMIKIADFLADYLYGRPLEDRQRADVVEALVGGGDPNAPLSMETCDLERLRGVVRLMLSTAEFQVC